MRARTLAPLAVLALSAVLSVPALAQDGGLDGHGFTLAAQDGDIRDPLTLQRPGRMHAGGWYLHALFEYNEGTLRQPVRGSDPDPVERVYLDSMAGLNVVGGVSVHKMLRLDLRVPGFITSRGHASTNPTSSRIGSGFGTMRAAIMFAPLQPGEDGGFGLGVVPWLDLPTATHPKNMGYANLAGGGKLAATYETSALTFSGNVGYQARPKVEGYENLTGGARLLTGLGVGYAITERLGVNAEAYFDPSLEPKPEVAEGETAPPALAESPAEVLLSVKGNTEVGLNWTVGGAVGVTEGAGAARFRLFVGAGFGRYGNRVKVIGDRDEDGIADNVDDCPGKPETVNAYKDQDGCPDELGSVALTATDGGASVPGLPLVVSGSGGEYTATSAAGPVTVEDVVPGSYTLRSADANYQGSTEISVAEGANTASLSVVATAPGTLSITAKDADGKPVPGATATATRPGDEGSGTDVALAEDGTGSVDLPPGPYAIFAQADGYGIARADTTVVSKTPGEVALVLTKAKTEMKAERIDILEKVYFQQGSAVLQSRSNGLLDEVSNVLLRNPDLLVIEVAGHTSAEGSLELNNRLSNERAEAVRNYLIAKGVAGDRLVAEGYGPSQPLVKETSEAKRAKNRRVEFVIKERKESAE